MTAPETRLNQLNRAGAIDSFDVQILGKFKASEWVNNVKREKPTHRNLKCGLVGMYQTIWLQVANEKANGIQEMQSYRVTVSLKRQISEKGVSYKLGEIIDFKGL